MILVTKICDQFITFTAHYWIKILTRVDITLTQVKELSKTVQHLIQKCSLLIAILMQFVGLTEQVTLLYSKNNSILYGYKTEVELKYK